MTSSRDDIETGTYAVRTPRSQNLSRRFDNGVLLSLTSAYSVENQAVNDATSSRSRGDEERACSKHEQLTI